MIIFLNLIIAPTIISIIDDTHEVSAFIDLNEEEEKGKESAKDLDVKIQPSENNSSFMLKEIQNKKNLIFLTKNYISKYPKIFTPPPKLVL
jgi:hypothetical protein